MADRNVNLFSAPQVSEEFLKGYYREKRDMYGGEKAKEMIEEELQNVFRLINEKRERIAAAVEKVEAECDGEGAESFNEAFKKWSEENAGAQNEGPVKIKKSRKEKREEKRMREWHKAECARRRFARRIISFGCKVGGFAECFLPDVEGGSAGGIG